jgi:hypothetical protein
MGKYRSFYGLRDFSIRSEQQQLSSCSRDSVEIVAVQTFKHWCKVRLPKPEQCWVNKLLNSLISQQDGNLQ